MKENFGHKKFFVIKKIYYEKTLVTKKKNCQKIFCHKKIFVIENFCNEKKNLCHEKKFLSKILVIKILS